MKGSNKYRVLIWIIVILLATNISMGISFFFHKNEDIRMMEQADETKIEVPAQQRTRFFREQLKLNNEQLILFRELNRNFNQNAWDINHKLEALRIEMVTEMGKEIPDKTRLDSISTEIGTLHSQLKGVTINYYLQMKEVCDERQKEKLNEIFMSVLKQNEDVKLPEYGRNRINSES